MHIIPLPKPDPTDCTQYYFCAGDGGDSLVYQCPAKFVYNSASTLCRRRTADNCAQVDCTNHENEYAQYPGNRQLYAFCQGSVLAPTMMRCPSSNHMFSELEQQCAFECPDEGRFEDVTNPEAYYECLPLDEPEIGWSYEHLKCLSGFTFNKRTQQCEWDASRQTTTTTTTTTVAPGAE